MRSFTFRNSKGSYTGIPIIAANMDTVGTFEMALALHQVATHNAWSFFQTHKRILNEGTWVLLLTFLSLLFFVSLQFSLFTTVHKHYSVDDWVEFAAKHPECVEVPKYSLLIQGLVCEVFSWVTRFFFLLERSCEHWDWRRGLWEDLCHLGGSSTAEVHLCGRGKRLLWALCSLRQGCQGQVPLSYHNGQKGLWATMCCIETEVESKLFFNFIFLFRLETSWQEKWWRSWSSLGPTSSKWASDQVTAGIMQKVFKKQLYIFGTNRYDCNFWLWVCVQAPTLLTNIHMWQ